MNPGTQIMTPPIRMTSPSRSSRVGISPRPSRSWVCASTPKPTRRTTNGPRALTTMRSKERPQEPDRVGDSHEGDDLRGKKQKCSQKDHT